MNVKMISCWFATSYGDYTDGLRRGLERMLGNEVGIIASNCGCEDDAALRREFKDDRCEYFEFPNLDYWKSSSPAKNWLRLTARQLLYRERARRLLARSGDADVLHFQQILNATGSVTVFNWLARPSRAARVVTVHELDPYQVDVPKTNLQYNQADRILVHAAELKEAMVKLGVDPELIDIRRHGVEILPLADGPREGIVFYGGHFVNKGKGLDVLIKAMAIVKSQLGAKTPVVSIHGFWGEKTPQHAPEKIAEAGLVEQVRWLNQLTLPEATALYQRSLLCVLPYSGSFAGYAAGLASANGTPVIATRRAGLPDHLGDAARWIETDDAEGLATAIVELLGSEAQRRELAARGRARAEAELSWDAIAKKTFESYQKALESRKRKDSGLRGERTQAHAP